MTVTRLDPLLHRPGPMRIVCKIFYRDGSRSRGCAPAQPLDHHLRRVTEIGDESERARAGMKRVPDRIDRIVRDGKSLDGDVADRKVRASPKEPPIAVLG